MASETVRDRRTDANTVEKSIRVTRQNPVGRDDVSFRNFVIAGQNIQDKELAAIGLFNIWEDVALIKLLSATCDFLG